MRQCFTKLVTIPSENQNFVLMFGNEKIQGRLEQPGREPSSRSRVESLADVSSALFRTPTWENPIRIFFLLITRHNPLKTLISDERIQGNPRPVSRRFERVFGASQANPNGAKKTQSESS